MTLGCPLEYENVWAGEYDPKTKLWKPVIVKMLKEQGKKATSSEISAEPPLSLMEALAKKQQEIIEIEN